MVLSEEPKPELKPSQLIERLLEIQDTLDPMFGMTSSKDMLYPHLEKAMKMVIQLRAEIQRTLTPPKEKCSNPKCKNGVIERSVYSGGVIAKESKTCPTCNGTGEAPIKQKEPNER